jgi:ABC-2 type transport system permease protein
MMHALKLSLIRLRAMLGKEFLQLFRDPRMRFFLIIPPLVQILIFGYAANFDVREANIAIIDQAHTEATRAMIADITATGHYTVHFFQDMKDASAAMDRNQARAILYFPTDFGRSGQIQVIADGSDSNSAQLVVGQLSQTVRYSAERIYPDQGNPLRIEIRSWYNPNLEDRWYFVPGIIANVVLVATMVLTAMTVVREREQGTLERLMVTPLGRMEFIIGKMMPVACVGLFDVLLVTLVSVFWFGVPFRGDPLALLLGSMLFLMSTLGLGLLISSYASTQQQAMLLAFFVIMPATILSGFAFPIRNMPEPARILSWLDPLRYYIVVIRDLFLKGGGIGDHPLQYAMMALLGLFTLVLSMFRIR